MAQCNHGWMQSWQICFYPSMISPLLSINDYTSFIHQFHLFYASMITPLLSINFPCLSINFTSCIRQWFHLLFINFTSFIHQWFHLLYPSISPFLSINDITCYHTFSCLSLITLLFSLALKFLSGITTFISVSFILATLANYYRYWQNFVVNSLKTFISRYVKMCPETNQFKFLMRFIVQ